MVVIIRIKKKKAEEVLKQNLENINREKTKIVVKATRVEEVKVDAFREEKIQLQKWTTGEVL